jgi:membrane peptidoglycan carboxypeptidase
MTENTRQVLEMLAEGKITTEEADRLISALREQPAAPGAAPAKKPRYLRVIVDAEDAKQGPVKVNIRVPLMLLRAGVRLASVIPPQAQEKVNRALREQGVDLDISTIKPENLEELIDELQDLTVDIEQRRDDVKVKVFVE